MERMKENLAVAAHATGRLREALTLETNDIVSDPAVQRFEFSLETTWKALQHFPQVVHGMEATSPRSVIQESFQVALLTEEETAPMLAMTDDRNLTSHTYNETLAMALFGRLTAGAALLAMGKRP